MKSNDSVSAGLIYASNELVDAIDSHQSARQLIEDGVVDEPKSGMNRQK